MDMDGTRMDLGEVVQRIKHHKQNKLSRYFKYHKWRIIFIIICVILLFICAFMNYPINGDLYEGTDENPATILTTSISLIGFISAQVFVTLFITVLSIETFMSRQELDQLKLESSRISKTTLKQNKNNTSYLSKLYNIIINTFPNFNKNRKTTSQVFINAIGSSPYELNNEDLYNEIKKIIVKLNSDQITELVEKMQELESE